MFSRTESLALMAAALVGASIYFLRAEREARARSRGRTPIFVRFAAWLALAKSMRAALLIGAWALRGTQHVARAHDARAVLPYIGLHVAVDVVTAFLLFAAAIAMLARRANARTVSLVAALLAVVEGYLPALASQFETFREGAALDAGAMGWAGTLAVPIEAAVVFVGGWLVSRAIARDDRARD